VGKPLRRLCGWEHRGELPSETTFSRAFAEFAGSALPCRLHEALIKQAYKDRLVGHVSRESKAGRETEDDEPCRDPCRNRTVDRQFHHFGHGLAGRSPRLHRSRAASGIGDMAQKLQPRDIEALFSEIGEAKDLKLRDAVAEIWCDTCPCVIQPSTFRRSHLPGP
jgi:hypothetical protein